MSKSNTPFPIQPTGSPAATRTIAFLNQKGGVGKTTTVCNLAAAMADAGRVVGVVDLDPQAHLSLHLGVESSSDESGEDYPTVYDVLVDESIPADRAFHEARPNLFVLPAEVDLAAAEVELSAEEDRHYRLARKIKGSPLAREFDFLLIDCPPSLGLLTLNALGLAREVFVPMQAHFLALQGLSRLLETVGMVSQKVNPSLQVAGIILCMFEGNTKLASEIVSDLTEFFESQRAGGSPWRRCRVLQPPIRRNIKLAESPSFGQSIFDYDANCAGAKDYLHLAENLLEEWDTFLALRDRLRRDAETDSDSRSESEAESPTRTSTHAPASTHMDAEAEAEAEARQQAQTEPPDHSAARDDATGERGSSANGRADATDDDLDPDDPDSPPAPEVVVRPEIGQIVEVVHAFEEDGSPSSTRSFQNGREHDAP